MNNTKDRSLLGTIKSTKRIFLAVIIVSFSLGVSIALSKDNIFVSQAIIAPQSSSGEFDLKSMGTLGNLANIAGFGRNNSNVDSAIEILTSRVFVNELIEENLFKPAIFPSQWNSKAEKWREPSAISNMLNRLKNREDRNASKYDKNEPNNHTAYNQFTSDIYFVTKDSKSDFIKITAKHTDPHTALRIVSASIRKLNSDLRKKAIVQSEQNILFLEKRLKTTKNVVIKETIYKLIEANLRKSMLAETTNEFAFEVISQPIEAEEKSSPQRLKIVISSIIVGISFYFLGIFAIAAIRLPDASA